MLGKIKCRFGFHKWLVHDEPVVGRRSLQRRSSDGKSVTEELGPEETFYPNPDGPIHSYRDCLRCGKRQIEFAFGWR